MIPKCNAALMDAVFELMFETLWLVPCDRRRCNTAYVEYEVCVRHAARMLSALDPSETTGEESERLSQAVYALTDSIRRLCSAGIFLPAQCAAAMKVAERIERTVAEKVAEEQM